MLSERVYNSVTIVLSTGSIVCGFLVIYYGTKAQETCKHLEGTLITTEKSDQYRLRVDGTGDLTPPFSLQSSVSQAVFNGCMSQYTQPAYTLPPLPLQ